MRTAKRIADLISSIEMAALVLSAIVAAILIIVFESRMMPPPREPAILEFEVDPAADGHWIIPEPPIPNPEDYEA